MSLTSTHYFCGGGGDTLAAKLARFRPVTAVNHDAASVATHRLNFPECDTLNSNIEQIEPRKLPRTDVLWASPICTEISPAGGRKRKRQAVGQSSLFAQEEGERPENFERTRVTALAIISAAEAKRYDIVMGENVIEFGTDWELYDWWVQGMRILGYEYQVINVNAAHIATDTILPAPQWRDRMFFIFWRKGITFPKMEPRPLAPCNTCGEVVKARQWWKDRKTRFGKYGPQYLYRCPNRKCRHEVVEPFVRPAADIIDWSHIGARIGDRTRPLAPNTRRRVQAGLDKFGPQQVMVTLNHAGHDGRAFLPHTQPLPVRSTKIGEGIVTPPMLVPCGGTYNDTAYPTDRPMRTRLVREAEALVVPEPFVAELRRHGTARSVGDPLSTITSGGNHHALVVPNGAAGPANIGHAVEVDDCHLRMLQPREQFLSQGFPPDYKLTGTKTQQTAQAGNSIPVNVGQWICEAAHEALGGGAR